MIFSNTAYIVSFNKKFKWYTETSPYFSSAPSPSWWPPATPASPLGSWPCRRTTCSWPCCGSSAVVHYVPAAVVVSCEAEEEKSTQTRVPLTLVFMKLPPRVERQQINFFHSFKFKSRFEREGHHSVVAADPDTVNRVVGSRARTKTKVTGAWLWRRTRHTSFLCAPGDFQLNSWTLSFKNTDTDSNRL